MHGQHRGERKPIRPFRSHSKKVQDPFVTHRRRVIRRSIYFAITYISAISILTIGCFLYPPFAHAETTGTTPQMCGQYDRKTIGRYVISNDAWGYASYSGQQCITPASNGFTVSTATGNYTNVMGYPHIGLGCDYNLLSCTLAAGLPVRATQIGGLHSSWSTTQAAAGEWDASYDMYVGNANYPSALTARTEIMVWLNSKNVPIPSCTKLYIDGAYWCMWYHPFKTWTGTFVAFRRVVPVSSVKNLSLRPFISYTIKRGWTKKSWRLDMIDAGFEIWRGGQGLTVNSFKVTPW